MRRSPLLIAFVVSLTLLSCSRGPCHQACRRVAECKRQKVMGDRIPGDSVPPPDPTCMERCEAATLEYASCEGKARECAGLLQCIPYR
jgi:Cys-rich protein (TIGR04453 family)